MERKPQTVGFVHRFFVPGWIGFIQECIIENKMSKAAKQPIHKGLNYYECAELIMKLTGDICKERLSENESIDKSFDNPDNIEIMKSVFGAIEAWSNVYPEIAFYKNVKISERFISCAYNVTLDNCQTSLKKIMELPKSQPSNKGSERHKKVKRRSSFRRDMQAFGYQMVAIFCNIIVLGVVACTISGICSLF